MDKNYDFVNKIAINIIALKYRLLNSSRNAQKYLLSKISNMGSRNNKTEARTARGIATALEAKKS